MSLYFWGLSQNETSIHSCIQAAVMADLSSKSLVVEMIWIEFAPPLFILIAHNNGTMCTWLYNGDKIPIVDDVINLRHISEQWWQFPSDGLTTHINRERNFLSVLQCVSWLPDHPSSHLEEQFLCVLGAVAEVSGADVAAPIGWRLAEMQQVFCVQQNGIKRVDSYTTSHQQQIYRRVGRWRVKEEVPTDAHCHAGTHSTLQSKRRKKLKKDLQMYWNEYMWMPATAAFTRFNSLL